MVVNVIINPMQIKRFFILVIILLSFGTGSFAESINVEKLNFDLGMQNLKQDNLEEAAKYFNLVIDKNPMNVEAHYNLAITYKKMGKNKEALGHFSTVVKLLNDPQAYETKKPDDYNQIKSKENEYIDLADMHADNGQYKNAIEYYNLALKLNPYNDNTYFKVSQCYVELKDYNNAGPYIRRALELDTVNSRYKHYKDLVEKNTDSKIRIVLENLNPADPLKDYQERYYAKEFYNDDQPKKVTAEKTLVTKYYQDNDNKEILEKLSRNKNEDVVYKQSQELDYIDLGDMHFDNQEYETAIKYYNMALNINPNNDYTNYKLSRCYVELGQNDKANQYIEKALALSGKNKKYVFYKNRITDITSGRPTSLEQSGENTDPFYSGNPIAKEPSTEVPQSKISLWEKMKLAVSSVKPPSVKVPGVNEIKLPKIEGKIVQNNTKAEEDNNLERYQISEREQTRPESTLEEPEPQSQSLPANDYNNRGIQFYNANNLEKAEDYFTKATQLSPMDPRGFNNLANVEVKRGNLLKAKEYALKAVTVDPQFAPGYYNLAVISKKQKDFISEITYLNKAIEVDPRYYEAYFARGLAYYNRGDSAKAKYNFTEVLKYKNDHYLASQNLGIVYTNELNYQQAERYLQQAVRLNTNNAQSYFYLGFVQQNSGKVPESIENLERSIELNPTNFKTYITLTKSYEANNQIDKALETLERAAEKNPENAEVYNYLGLMNLKFKNYSDACLSFGKAVQKNANRPIYHYNLSQCYLCLGKKKESNLAFQRAVSIIPVSVQDYIDLGEIFLDRGMAAYAIENLKTGISQLPGSDYLYLVLADFYERTGAKKIAIQTLRDYLNKKGLVESTFTMLVRKRLSELETGT